MLYYTATHSDKCEYRMTVSLYQIHPFKVATTKGNRALNNSGHKAHSLRSWTAVSTQEFNGLLESASIIGDTKITRSEIKDRKENSESERKVATIVTVNRSKRRFSDTKGVYRSFAAFFYHTKGRVQEIRMQNGAAM